MMEKWQIWQEKVAALSVRERGILTGTLIVVLLVFWLQFIFTPIDKQSQQVKRQSQALNQQIASQAEQIASLAASLQNNPNDQLRAEQAQLKIELNELNEDIETRLDTLVPPEKMADLMREVLADYKGLSLVSAKNLPVEPIYLANAGEAKQASASATASNTGSKAQAAIYAHGFEMELSGAYFQALEFLKRLEALEGFYWQMLDYEVSRYPKATIIIRLSTLSLEEDWIGV